MWTTVGDQKIFILLRVGYQRACEHAGKLRTAWQQWLTAAALLGDDRAHGGGAEGTCRPWQYWQSPGRGTVLPQVLGHRLYTTVVHAAGFRKRQEQELSKPVSSRLSQLQKHTKGKEKGHDKAR